MEYTHLLDKANKLAKNITASTVSRLDALNCYRGMYLPSLGYSLPATNFLEKQLKKVEVRPKRALLAGMGYNRNMATAIVHGPKQYAGIGMLSLFLFQGIAHVMYVLKHLRSQISPLHNMLVIFLAWYQQVAGTSKSILEDTRVFPHVEAPWIDTTRAFLRKTSSFITTEHIRPIQPRRQHDECIMDIALDLGYKPWELRSINRCRLFLQVETVSDLATPDGKFLQDSLYIFPPTVNSVSTDLWPRQACPQSRFWAQWRHLLRQLTHDSSRRLRQPLGAWQSLCRRRWEAYYQEASDSVIVPHNNNWLH